jgi:hypothetical protein
MFCDTTASLIEFHVFHISSVLMLHFCFFFPSDTSTVAERQKGNMCEADQKAVHFGNVEAFQDDYFYE